MPRQARLDSPGTLHHVTIRGIEGAQVFQDDQDRVDFISRMDRLVEKTGTQVLAWVLMDNHLCGGRWATSVPTATLHFSLTKGEKIWYFKKSSIW